MRASSSFLISVNFCSVSKTWFFKHRNLSSASQPLCSLYFFWSLASFRSFCLASISVCSCLLLTDMWSACACNSRPRYAMVSMALCISSTSCRRWVILSWISSVFSHKSCTAPRCISSLRCCSLTFMVMPSRRRFVVSPLSATFSLVLTCLF